MHFTLLAFLSSLIYAQTVVSQKPYSPLPFYTFSPQYQHCDKILTPVSKAIGTSNAVLPLLPSPRLPAIQNGNITFTGSLILADGCSFSTANFTYSGMNESYWFGSFQDSSSNQGMILSGTQIPNQRHRSLPNRFSKCLPSLR